jgi:hypothetical protein
MAKCRLPAQEEKPVGPIRSALTAAASCRWVITRPANSHHDGWIEAAPYSRSFRIAKNEAKDAGEHFFDLVMHKN